MQHEKGGTRLGDISPDVEKLSSGQVSALSRCQHSSAVDIINSTTRMWRSFRVNRCQHLSSRLDIWKGIRASASAQRCSEYTFAKWAVRKGSDEHQQVKGSR